jgi:hypothetical protein
VTEGRMKKRERYEAAARRALDDLAAWTEAEQGRAQVVA